MYYYRITKYNPKNRTSDGEYLCNEWTSVYDVMTTGEATAQEWDAYLLVEAAYIHAIERIMEESGTEELCVKGLELRAEAKSVNEMDAAAYLFLKNLKEDVRLNVMDVKLFSQMALREQLWGKLVSKKMEVHFGYDYYMYIGTWQRPGKACRACIEKSGLYVEEHPSPYVENEDESAE